MTLLPAIDAYVELKRSLGAVFSTDSRILRSFGRSLGDAPLGAISAESCRSFCRGDGPPTRFWGRKHTTLRGFCRYLVSRGHLRASPLPEPGPRIRASFQPYIYSHDELQRLLDATVILDPRDSAWKPRTYRTLLLLLYGAGLRAGEALRLRCCDVMPRQAGPAKSRLSRIESKHRARTRAAAAIGGGKPREIGGGAPRAAVSGGGIEWPVDSD